MAERIESADALKRSRKTSRPTGQSAGTRRACPTRRAPAPPPARRGARPWGGPDLAHPSQLTGPGISSPEPAHRAMLHPSLHPIRQGEQLPSYVIVTLTLRNGLSSVPMTDTDQVAI